MRGRTISPWEIAAVLSLGLPVAALFVWTDARWPAAALALWVVAAGAVWWTGESRRRRERYERLLDHAHGSVIQTLSHHRHDWMNEMQVLYGYLRLNKPDKAIAVVDRIRTRMEHDSRLSHIGNPKLSIYLLSFRTMCDAMRLDVEVQDGLQLGGSAYEADRLAQAVIGMINVIRVRATSGSGYDNVLKLYMSRSAEGLRIDLVYTGDLAAAESVDAELAQCLNGIGHLETEQPEDGQAQARTMVARFPLPA